MIARLPKRWWLFGVLVLLFALALLAAKLIPSEHESASGRGNSQNSPVDWEGNLQFIKYSMDTPEPPDGGMHAYNNTTGGSFNMPCAWNDEDEVGLGGNGNLGSGVETHATLCMVADLDCCNPADYPKFIYARVYVKPTANLHVWVTLDGPIQLPDGRIVESTIEAQPWFLVNWTGSGQLQEYQLCGPDAVAHTAHRQGWSQLSYWPLVPGTAGYGVQVSYTIHIQNLGKQPARGIRAYYEIGFNDWDKTDSYSPYFQHFGPPDTLIPCPDIS